ncbi:MAG: Dam family site-specific DNA-(adenine-N6)-methyltransferase [Sterolibacterium sp.]|nr:Dam family site-specific DNA-(adenine-N6)-methyltransferase [Sterolibacterium sp.]
MDKETPPFLKWAGGKRWLISLHTEQFPVAFNRYFEPFLGSGAVFFALRPNVATLSDLNLDLVDTYKGIRDKWQAVEKLLQNYHNTHSKEHYLKVRQSKPRSLVGKAARFIYLNRTCWNALYRVNMKGQFNVPMGTKTNVILGTDDFEDLASILQRADILHQDFETVIDQAQEGDFIFADPPYTVKHNFNGFVKYNEKIFHWDDQVRLSKCLINAKNRGCLVLITNAYHPSILELYENDFDLTPLKRSSVIAASSEYRGVYEELLIKNYPLAPIRRARNKHFGVIAEP